ncbi:MULTISPECIES: bacteriochlorophyll 4-vinyl reductase [unclassified Exiguobacterium]|uniref:bacteriochlorophyll 4-vinyl reductase n=1 Tax=unclassified Exiguobacterium TaxID=2644629 RepID=UPI00103A7EE9|nr:MULTISPECIES: bacteriochlorophyll 4-vinyl reductase [unclassified Exiguobacterium]TCI45977.1 bacteriochlorophyll 4-vinyl reductase [Exiguobacterium sp. SH5S32]TCI51734.1 bacteriochlorophyll 4-vinyl reductase [Exiguobacterium sp. SH1S4]TCI71720.1 bacteriochlorophyll 4-vinyl reductase [Exiguobacterium sp. SH1S1]
MSKGSEVFEVLMTNAVKLPGVKVDRREFLAQSFSRHVPASQLAEIMEKGPIGANVPLALIKKIAKRNIANQTMKSSSASFAAGLPGGIGLAATIPADTAQFFGFSLRLAQETGYLYGYDDFWENGELDVDRVNGDLVLFLGVMFGVGGATATIKALSAQLSKQALKQLPKKALTKTVYFPIIKKMSAMIGFKMTKDTFAKGVSKMIPLAGGVISGGLTFSSMTKMGNRLLHVLEDSVNMTEEELVESFAEMKREHFDIIEAEFVEIEAVLREEGI